MNKEMPKVNVCTASGCVYNKEKHCNTIAITVGNEGNCAGCDTSTFVSRKAGIPFVDGEVGACKKTDCRYNNSWECNAELGIEVGLHKKHPDCRTYDPKKR